MNITRRETLVAVGGIVGGLTPAAAQQQKVLPIRSINTDADHRAALERVEALWDAELDTPEHDEFKTLVDLISAYENEHWPIFASNLDYL